MKKNPATSPNDSSKHILTRHPALWVCLCLILIVAVLYARTAGHDFIYCDDDQYVFQNPQVMKGLTAETVKWAFGRFHSANWHPLTWLSHMLDVELFGLGAGPHHLVNAGFHAVNSALLFLLLRMMTGALWPSALVAALFAVHPLRVESVAWVAERKDVLSGLFFMLCLMAYTRYARRPGILCYLPVFVLMALGLMSKSMLVTLPCVMLLLDVWPLGRWRISGTADNRFPTRPVTLLLLEKAPLFALSAGSCLLTVMSQKAGTALGNLDALPLVDRLSNAVIAYVLYLWKTVWPFGLAIFYPHPALIRSDTYSALGWRPVDAFVLLAVVSFFAVRWFRRRPYVAVGWCWYLGTMVPVIGIVQVGMQSMADRYAYLPLIGIYVAAVWGIREVCVKRGVDRRIPALAGTAILLFFTVASWFQVGHWKDSRTLFQHALRVTENNFFVHNHLGRAFENNGELKKAVEQYELAVRVKPDYTGAYSNLGSVLAQLGDLDRAVETLSQSVRLDPGFASGFSNLGLVYERRGRPELAVSAYRKALERDPSLFAPHYNLGLTLIRYGDLNTAAAHLDRALKLNPFHADCANALTVALMRLNRLEAAAAACRHALGVDPEHRDALNNLGMIYHRQGKNALAEAHLKKALEIHPDHTVALCSLGMVYEKQEKIQPAAAAYEQALRVDAGAMAAHRGLGFICAAQGDLNRAAAHLDTVLKVQPEDADVLNAMGFVYGKAGNIEQARRYLERALSVNPSHEMARMNLEHLGDRKQ